LDIVVGGAGGGSSGIGGGGGGSFVWEQSIPEPSTWAMMLLGFAGLGFAGYRTSRRVASIAA
jgi:hypothetical protein